MSFVLISGGDGWSSPNPQANSGRPGWWPKACGGGLVPSQALCFAWGQARHAARPSRGVRSLSTSHTLKL